MFSEIVSVLKISKYLDPQIGGVEKIAFLMANVLRDEQIEVTEIGHRGIDKYDIPTEKGDLLPSDQIHLSSFCLTPSFPIGIT